MAVAIVIIYASPATQPTFISGGQWSMGASRPPHSMADTPRGGPVQPTSALALWQGLGNHHSGTDP
eukprot:scaffold37642_cov30-Tisochrysis_lutea.AAC.9